MRADIRILDASGLAMLVDWAGAEGWNPGLGDSEAFRTADPDGFLGAFVNGEMAAGIAAVAYGDSFGFIGLYICRPDARGRGLGKAVWDAGLAHLGKRTIGLDGVAAQQPSYRAKGFKPSYETIRYTGRPQPGHGHPSGGGVSVLPYGHAMQRSVAELDAMCFPALRGCFMDGWLRMPRQALVALRDEAVVGFGALRRCHSGCKIGPLFARDFDAAAALFPALAQHTSDELSIDVPERQKSFRTMLEQAGMLPGFTTARMYRGLAPRCHIDWVYGLTTLELG